MRLIPTLICTAVLGFALWYIVTCALAPTSALLFKVGL